MRIDLGLVLAIVLEYIFFIYYADTLFYKKRNKYFCYSIIAVGYIIHMIICTFGNVMVNVTVAFLVNFLGLFLCYHVTLKTAFFQSAILDILCTASEYFVIFMPYIGIVPYNPSIMSPSQSLILTLISRTLYLIEIMIAGRLFYKNRKEQVFPSVWLISIPIITTVILMSIVKINVTSNLLAFVSILLVAINVIIFAINQKMVIKELEISSLKEQELKEQIDFEEYNLLKEEVQRVNVLRHDLKEMINGLNIALDSGNEEAKRYISQFEKTVDASRLTEYSDNKIFNVLLSQKKTECDDQGIKFLIEPIQAHLSFVRDMDIVIIFSNLINNAIESCNRSTEKKIFLNVSTVNDNFIVIKIDNSSDERPIVIDGRLRTHKDNEKLHGIGMNSIRRAIKDYSGHLDWNYDENEKMFTTTVIIKAV